MIEVEWTILPYPFSHFAREAALPALDTPALVQRLLEDCAGKPRHNYRYTSAEIN
jgi:hypothetical protein